MTSMNKIESFLTHPLQNTFAVNMLCIKLSASFRPIKYY